MADDAAREQRRVQEREASVRRDAEARVRAEEDARARDEEVRRAKRNAYLGLLPLYTTIGAVVAMFGVCMALDVELPSAVFFVVGGFQLVLAGIAAFMTAKPIQTALRADSNQMMAYHWIWVIFSMFVFPFGPIVFIVGLKRFFGAFSASTLQNSSGYHHIKAAKLSQRESWPAGLFFLAMSLGVASEVGAGIVYGQDQSQTQQQQKPPAKRGR